MPCSHCKQSGHNYVTCSHLTTEQKKKIKEDKFKKKKENIEKRKLLEQKFRLEQERQRILKIEKEKNEKENTYIVNNPNSYELSLYFTTTQNPNNIRHFTYIEPNSSKNIQVYPHNIILFYPTLDVLIENSHNAIKKLPVNHSKQPILKLNISDFNDKLNEQKQLLIQNYRESLNNNVINFYNVSSDDNNNNCHSDQLNYYNNVNHIQMEKIIYIEQKVYIEEKTELEKWKEVGLKSNYLLQELIKLGGEKYENLEPIFDMVKDIPIPEHTPHDREIAGIPSILTNVVGEEA